MGCGINIISDPGFDTPDDDDPWVTLSGWSIISEMAHNDGAVGTMTQTITI
jgi:hypothetical protein